MFTAQEKQLFLPTVRQCLENRPDKRPSSAVLVRELRHIESSLPSGGHVAAAVEEFRQQLSGKEEECRRKEEALKEKDEALREKDEVLQMALREKDKALKDKNDLLRENRDLQETIREQQASDQAQRTANQKQQDTIRAQQDTIRAQQDTIRAQQDTIRAQQDTIRAQQDTIRAQQAEIDQLKKQPAVAKQVSCPFALDCSNSMYSISANDITESRPSFGSASEVITKQCV